jgi:hypothetical protein
MNMNLNEMQNLWNSPRNNLPTADQQRVAQQFTRQMIRRRRFQAVWLTNTFVWLTVITTVAIWTIAVGKTKPGLEWGLFPLLVVPWAFAIHFLHRYLKPVMPVARGELSVVDSLRAAIGSNQAARSHLKLVGGLFVIMIPLLAVSMQQLHVAGKVSARELVCMGVFFGGTLLLSAAGIASRYFGRLLPQQRKLNALIGELTNEGE